MQRKKFLFSFEKYTVYIKEIKFLKKILFEKSVLLKTFWKFFLEKKTHRIFEKKC